ncbi:CDP-diacylglycerol--serine O-phosphatidyltransferase [Sulfurimonas gotlandica GD1]|jgi:CDP-diacylglycerol--serine O-phosphatidyltransferase|uniref:CDP-diacylglycerol--serine O-phosphatidyltransferase n=1 Tax=Sulfurimonas gotlandica (strain DSM 19862 / JCM 16533 / GD1) TaxID=929558 RepID=B6BIL3_SULGG|nr:CDP-diacylglycerol--serine O-phosphatidyltransferase [Sulfurimonas gotlandica]EDZ62798.1 CDP-diacylglycerol--serine O-phosphatidyltransferase [Sulfurimonas gotlandica GD1]EHP30368.1 CDP-diacylglycerol--serine O-phosphatidyltransferase [Sulfurimonas gotlandica GD1]
MTKKPANLIYILPNLFTAASIFSGVFSIISAVNGNFEKAAWLIMLSLIFDGLDGRVARLTNTCSKFGVEFDSLADMVAFGVAPALLMYLFVGYEFGRFGVVASAIFVIFGAIRLARFNVMTVTTEPSVFIGVPIPTAAVFVSLMVLLFQKYGFNNDYGLVIMLLSILVSILMVSNIRYPSFKKIDFSPKHAMKFFVIIISALFVVFMYPIEGFTLIFVLYILYGLVRAAMLMPKSLGKK